MKHFDLCIVGGNMVGASLALALADSGLKIALIEKQSVKWQDPQAQQVDLRVSAIIPAVVRMFKKLGVWEQMLARRVQPFNRMTVWEDELTNAYEFDAQSVMEPYLGYVVENTVIQHSLWQALQAKANVTCICAEWTQLQETNDGICLDLTDTAIKKCTARLLVAADGAQSQVRQWAGIERVVKAYHQACIVGNVKTHKPHQNCCWQRYEKGYPFAFLPLADGSCSIAWYMSLDDKDQHLELSTAEIETQLFQASAGVLGQVEKVGVFAGFPVQRHHAKQWFKDRIVLIGDAAHGVHPMAGQGANLGFIDAAVLAEEIMAAEGVFDHPLVLKRYQRRRAESFIIEYGMDAFLYLFKDLPPPLKMLRHIGLKQGNKISMGKHLLREYALGNSRDLPALMGY